MTKEKVIDIYIHINPNQVSFRQCMSFTRLVNAH